MKKYFFFLIITSIFFSSIVSAQFSKYIIRFKDKAGTPFSINNPSQYLSPRAIQRRSRQNISIDSTDLPITPRYIDSIRLAGNVTILNRSKWLNQVCIQTTDAAVLAKINSFTFVISSSAVMRLQQNVTVNDTTRNKFLQQNSRTVTSQLTQATSDYFNYGSSYAQIHIHEGEYLHNKGFRGEGMLLAMMDAGFRNYLTLSAFDSVRNNNQIIETYDFVQNEISVNEDDPHGMYCFSIIAANLPGQLIGSSPKAKFYLYRTEDAATEYPVEEQNWAAAAEKADSIGVDVFSTSLGYTTFDNPVFNHTYADMNGKITIIAKANALAAKKGIISVVAAGNDGNNAWHYISTPADADGIVTVGSVNAAGVSSSFSSYGPSSDGRIKPTVASVGQGTFFAALNNQPGSGNGTSLATPILAGLITCLWQAYPEFSAAQIIEAVKRSSSKYAIPDDRIGYGIPNFRLASLDLDQQRIIKNANAILGTEWIKVYPNPFKNNLTILINPKQSGTAVFKLYDASGKLYVNKIVPMQQSQIQFITFTNLQPLAKGVYTLRYSAVLEKGSIRIMAQ